MPLDGISGRSKSITHTSSQCARGIRSNMQMPSNVAIDDLWRHGLPDRLIIDEAELDASREEFFPVVQVSARDFADRSPLTIDSDKASDPYFLVDGRRT